MLLKWCQQCYLSPELLSQQQPRAPSLFHLSRVAIERCVTCCVVQSDPTDHSCFLFVSMPRHRFGRGSVNAFLLSGGGDTGNSNGGVNKQSRPRDESIKTSLYICIACGFQALDDPGLQFHLEGTWSTLTPLHRRHHH